jgi:hypothetical protein
LLERRVFRLANGPFVASVVVGAFREPERPESLVQALAASMLFDQLHLRGYAQLPPMKFFSKASSISFWPIIRSNSATRFS